MNKYYLILLSILITSCNSATKDEHTYFGGKIINPKNDLVLLYKGMELIDSIKLTKKNTFMSKLKNITPGLYFFKHGIEHQYVYLKPKDSLLLRLNTWGFDESLVFSGTGANYNNVLIEAFIQNEIDKKDFFDYYHLDQTAFEAKIDSIKKEKNLIVENFKFDNKDASDEFLDILDIALNYPIHTKLENYIRKKNIDSIPNGFNKSFLAHREKTNINRDSLMFYIPYRNYVYSHLYSDVSQQKLTKDSNQFTNALLKNISVKIKSTKQRDRLLRHITIRHFYNNSSCKVNKETFDLYFSLSSNEKDKKLIERLLRDVTTINDQDKIPSFTLLKPDGNKTTIDEVIKNEKTVIYFKGRRKTKTSDDWLASRVNYLKNKNKDTKFLIINVDKNQEKFIHKLDLKSQYSLDEESDAHRFLTSSFPRVFLINKEGIIKNSFGALSSDKIEKQITDLQ